MNDCTELKTCLACGSTNLTLQLDLGQQALANSYINEPSIDEPSFPLAVNLCHDCYHLQLTHIVDPAIIYRNYLYVSGTSKTLSDYFEWFARWSKEYCHIWPSTVLDIGCNDGTQLDYYKKLGLQTFGIDPAENLYPVSSRNHTIFCDFFNTKSVDELVDRKLSFDIIIAQNSFAHNPDPCTFLQQVKRLMKSTGLLFIQTSQADMVKNDEFDTIYHEHISFYNINSMNKLCQRAGMNLINVIKTPIHGTSYIFVISPTLAKPYNIKNLIDLEAKDRLLNKERYQEWSDQVRQTVNELGQTIDQYRNAGYRIIGYGAAAKGNTLLNFGKFQFDAIIDDNPLKCGLLTPGMNIPIVNVEYLNTLTDQDKVVFIPLAWNFYSEIKRRILDKRSNPQDIFVKYFPKLAVEHE